MTSCLPSAECNAIVANGSGLSLGKRINKQRARTPACLHKPKLHSPLFEAAAKGRSELGSDDVSRLKHSLWTDNQQRPQRHVLAVPAGSAWSPAVRPAQGRRSKDAQFCSRMNAGVAIRSRGVLQVQHEPWREEGRGKRAGLACGNDGDSFGQGHDRHGRARRYAAHSVLPQSAIGHSSLGRNPILTRNASSLDVFVPVTASTNPVCHPIFEFSARCHFSTPSVRTRVVAHAAPSGGPSSGSDVLPSDAATAAAAAVSTAPPFCLLQAFSWTSCRGVPGRTWYEFVLEKADEIADMGFSDVLLPPCCVAEDEQGFYPLDFYDLDAAYGSLDSLQRLISRLHESSLRVGVEVVVNRLAGMTREEPTAWRRSKTGLDEEVDWIGWTAKVSPTNGAIATSSSSSGTDTHSSKNGSIREKAKDAQHWQQDHQDQQQQQQQQQQADGRGRDGPSIGVPAVIDHGNPTVESDCRGWLLWLRREIGFDVWCFDLAKAFDPAVCNAYCRETSPTFAIADVWNAMRYNGFALEYDQDQHREDLCSWVRAAKGCASVMDYTTKGILQQAIERCEYWRLIDAKGRPPGLIGLWPEKAITFVDNHVTGSEPQRWPFPSWGVCIGYAYILTHPGTPCVLWDHVFDWKLKDVLQQLIAIRSRNNISCSSKVRILVCHPNLYVARVGENVHDDSGGTFRGIIVKLGPSFDMCGTAPGEGWHVPVSGHDFCIFERSNLR